MRLRKLSLLLVLGSLVLALVSCGTQAGGATITPTAGAGTPAGTAAVTPAVTGTVAPGGVVTPTGTLTGTVSPAITGTTTAAATGAVTETAAPAGTATGPTAGEGTPGQAFLAMGQTVYASNCASCHGDNGQGVGDAGPALNNNEFVTQDNPLPVVRTVLRGGGGMPPFRDVLSPEEIAAVVTYIRKSWDNNASIIDPQQVQQILGTETSTP